MKRRLRVGIIFGGKSAEHEVSLQSAKNVIQALDPQKYEPVLIGITKTGKWILYDRLSRLLEKEKLQLNNQNIKNESYLPVIPGEKSGWLTSGVVGKKIKEIDVIFPVLHGPLGEDGTVQGLLTLLDVPFVGSGVLGSAVGMDKDVMKRLLQNAGLPVVKFITLRNGQPFTYEHVKKTLGTPFFVKPANLGSSIGVSKVKDKMEFRVALRNAFKYDRKILIEQYIKGRELECSVLGNEQPVVSLPGEIFPQHEFYSYEAKYVDPNGTRFEIPAKLSPLLIRTIKNYALQAFQVLCAEGMARVDFFLTLSNKLYINEINTIPGFTAISMYPKLWEASGVSQGLLVDRLIKLALERHKKLSLLKHSYV